MRVTYLEAKFVARIENKKKNKEQYDYRIPNVFHFEAFYFSLVGWSLVFAISICFLYSFGSNYERTSKEEANKGANAILYKIRTYMKLNQVQ